MLSKIENVNFAEILKKNKVIPVAIFSEINSALKTAELLLNNSIDLLEITLRTEIAFKCIREITKTFPELVTGAGSVLSVDAFKEAIEDGARFGVAPALDFELVDYSLSKNVIFVPGISTPSELNSVIKTGLKFIKIFPASNIGGPDYIKAITAPFKMKDFYLIPTGGINEKNIAEYIKAERVIACGASYIVDGKLIEKGDFGELESRIKRTKTLF
ncbi:MAG: bifunctional 4-hydroxy-2-oxoglutarate aldolase/2-dehydro-3-deoxy-phosphogluconate aldolase [Spirochaetes bacterium]|nr:bifunctional 4-hydroxy-2-oxoglutarate aldolase/2-dehydro-3-deoxy-phosphogluconate aldolase [Spirochaetota bacterium]